MEHEARHIYVGDLYHDNKKISVWLEPSADGKFSVRGKITSFTPKDCEGVLAAPGWGKRAFPIKKKRLLNTYNMKNEQCSLKTYVEPTYYRGSMISLPYFEWETKEGTRIYDYKTCVLNDFLLIALAKAKDEELAALEVMNETPLSFTDEQSK